MRKSASSFPSAIQTRYRDRHYRSRIEARWACFFDVLKIEFEYEQEKFNVGGETNYIPDFFISEFGELDDDSLEPEGAFLEVKGAPPTEAEIAKAIALAGVTDRYVFVVHGSTYREATQCFPFGGTSQVSLSQCPMCGLFGFEPEPRGPDDGQFNIFCHLCFAQCEMAKRYDILSHFTQGIVMPRTSPMLGIAREAASSARFESPEWDQELDGIILAVLRLKQQGMFCSSEVNEKIIAEAHDWKSVKEPWMTYDEPWWMPHRENLRNKIFPCSCYRCARRREDDRECLK